MKRREGSWLPASWVGWRQTSIQNCFLTWIIFVGLTIPLILSIVADGFTGVHILFAGDCNTADKVNKGLHFALISISTLALLSTGFHLRLLCSPTRDEIDLAHGEAKSLEIGAISLLNFRHIPVLKFILWLGFLLTSIPLHLIFNAAVFMTDTSTAYNQAFASEGILNKALWSVPGVADLDEYDWANDSYGVPASQMFQSYNSDPTNWEELNTVQCLQAYLQPSNGLRNYRNLIVVVEAGPVLDPRGWTLSQLWGNSTPPPYNESISRNNESIPAIPETAFNSLWWFYTSCDIINYLKETSNICFELLDGYLDLESGPGTSFDGPWTFTWVQPDEKYLDPGFNYTYNNVTALYCMAERFDAPCKVEISNVLMFIVCIFILAQGILSLLVLYFTWNSHPLIILGDAIESFLDKPDPTTRGLCTLSMGGFAKLTKMFPQVTTVLIWAPMPRDWISSRKTLSRAVTRYQWLFAYTIALIVLILSMVLLSMGDSRDGGLTVEQSFGPSIADGAVHLAGGSNFVGLLSASILANTPQIAVAICYFGINSLLLRLLQAREWAQMSINFMPLRVTNAKGDQKSSYLLQYPWEYAIPFQAISAGIHWLTSQALYVTVNEVLPSTPTTTTTITYGVGYSTEALLTLLLASFCVLSIPFLLSLRTVPSDSIVVGGSSAAISAACHRELPMGSFSTLNYQDPARMSLCPTSMQTSNSRSVPADVVEEDCEESGNDGFTMHIHKEFKGTNLKSAEDRVLSGDKRVVIKIIKKVKLSWRKLKWGVLDDGKDVLIDGKLWRVGHLGLGSEEDDVQKVKEKECYA